MLWKLVQPPERGGLGMNPEAAKRLTPQEALFYLAEESAIEDQTRRYRTRIAQQYGKTLEDLKREVEEYKVRKREAFTGTAEQGPRAHKKKKRK